MKQTGMILFAVGLYMMATNPVSGGTSGIFDYFTTDTPPNKGLPLAVFGALIYFVH